MGEIDDFGMVDGAVDRCVAPVTITGYRSSRRTREMDTQDHDMSAPNDEAGAAPTPRRRWITPILVSLPIETETAGAFDGAVSDGSFLS